MLDAFVPGIKDKPIPGEETNSPIADNESSGENVLNYFRVYSSPVQSIVTDTLRNAGHGLLSPCFVLRDLLFF